MKIKIVTFALGRRIKKKMPFTCYEHRGRKERGNHSDFNLGKIIKEILIYLYEELFDIEKVLHTLEKLEDPEFEIFKFYVEKEGPHAVFFNTVESEQAVLCKHLIAGSMYFRRMSFSECPRNIKLVSTNLKSQNPTEDHYLVFPFRF